MRNLLLLMFVFLGLQTLQAQQTSTYTDPNLAYKDGMDFYQEGLFGQAQKAFTEVLDTEKWPHETLIEPLRDQAELYYALAAVRLEHPDGEVLVYEFIRKHAPSGIANKARLEMGNFYFNSKDFNGALRYYNAIDVSFLTKTEAAEVEFRKGYCYFVKKKFSSARNVFSRVKDAATPFREDAKYYYGLTSFFAKKYDEAYKEFLSLNNSKRYGKVIPYYISQIHFIRGDYDRVISTSEKSLKDRSVKYRKEISQLLGQSYFEKGEYKRALPHLETALASSSKKRPEDIYQVAYTQYKTDQFGKAIKNFEKLKSAKSALGQNALYNLGDSYLKSNKKKDARNAFFAASKLKYDKQVQSEARFNYAKLSYELKYDREAIKVLQTIQPGDVHYTESQEILSDVFLNTKDYENALKILDGMPNKSPKIREIYQKVAFYRGLQLYNDNNLREAKTLFNKSLNSAPDLRLKALTKFWLGDIAYKEKDYSSSIRLFGEYSTIARTIGNMPEDASLDMANYNLGYSYLRKDDFASAQKYFQDAVQGLKRNFNYIGNSAIKNNVLPDAILRTGDSYLKRNKYEDAMKYYQEVVNGNFNGSDYALFQIGIIEGVRQNTVDKILNLERVINSYPKSDYVDNAYYELGITLQRIDRLAEATTTYNKLVQKKPNSPFVNRALQQLGLIAFNQGENRKALDYYKRIYSNNPTPKESEEALAAIEEIYIDMGDTDGYFAFLETIPGGGSVSDLQKDNIKFKAAENQFIEGNYQKAIQAYTEYIRTFPNGANIIEANYQRGQSYYNLKDYPNAKRDYKSVLNRGNSRLYERALRQTALISYYIDKDYAGAYKYFKELEGIASTEDFRLEAQVNGAMSAFRSGDKQGVYLLASKVDGNPDATEIQKGDANYYLGKMAIESNDLVKARSAFNKVIKLLNNEKQAEAKYQIAYIYYVQRELDLAEDLCARMNEEIQGYPFWIGKSVLLLGDIFSEKGDYFTARVVLESLIENYEGEDDRDKELIAVAKEKLGKLEKIEDASSTLAPDFSDEGELEMDDDE